MTYSDLVAMRGKAEAIFLLEKYYDDRGLEYPWDVKPKRYIAVFDPSEMAAAVKTSMHVFQPIPAPEHRPDQNAQAVEAKDNEIEALKKQNVEVMTQLAEMKDMIDSMAAAQQRQP